MIEFDNQNLEFHLNNNYISYIIKIFKNGRLGNLYFGKRIDKYHNFSHLLQQGNIPKAMYQNEEYCDPSMHYTKMEYPVYGTGDFKEPALEIEQENGSKIVEFKYDGYNIFNGKPKLNGLPSLYVNNENEAQTLEIYLYDEIIKTKLTLRYTIFKKYPIIARNVEIKNFGSSTIKINKICSTSLDLPDSNYEMIQLSGAWSFERQIKSRKIQQGLQGISSAFGISSAEHNPFLILKRENTNEDMGEALGFSLIYSGNHIEHVEVSVHGITRVLQGINPLTFSWPLKQNESFQSPEALITYSCNGLNGLSQSLHDIYNNNLVRGSWKNKERPILINNWEATEMNFDENIILNLAKKAKELGIELFVLDDGWFGNRDKDDRGLGDWYVKNFNKLPNGIDGLSKKIEDLGLKFGLWIEPEMVNKNSDLYRLHPEWVINTPKRSMTQSRTQYVLNFANKDVIDYIYNMLIKVIDNAHISYIKWDMNRFITECYSNIHDNEQQGTIFHRYILGVYDLYERLIKRYPEILFESCSSGGLRFDPGMLYYAPQCWTSDDTDAIERIKIQYGTSLAYPISSMGAHVSEVPNQQVGRITPLNTRANVAMFGAFGYELDLNKLTIDEQNQIKEQIKFMKKHRKLLQFGTFYRINNPFETDTCAWMMVSKDQNEAILGYYRLLGHPNMGFDRVYLKGLNANKAYQVNNDSIYYGNELMNAGLMLKHTGMRESNLDFSSELYYLKNII